MSTGEEHVRNLSASNAPLSMYLETACSCYAHGDPYSFKMILEHCRERLLSGEMYGYELDVQIALIVALGSYYTTLGDKEIDIRRSSNFYEEAACIFSEGDRIDSSNPLLWAAKGFLILSKNRFVQEQHGFETAQFHFSFVLDHHPDYIPCLIGKGIVEFSTGRFKLAIITFKTIILLWSACPASIRVVLGLCFFNIGMYEESKVCFSRVLDLDPNNIDALLGMSIADYNLSPSLGSCGLLYLKKAYSITKTNPIVLNCLSNYLLLKNEGQKAEALALNAFQGVRGLDLNSSRVRAESCFILGKIYHSQENFEEAYRFYLQATKLDTKHDSAYFHLGQTQLYRQDIVSAIESFEKSLELHGRCIEAMKALASIYSFDPKEKKKGTKMMKDVIESNPDDIESLLEYAGFVEQSNPKEARDAYKSAFERLKSEGLPVSVEILNNYAVLLSGFDEEAEKIIGEAIECCESRTTIFTLKYNLGRILEACHKSSDAVEIYASLLSELCEFELNEWNTELVVQCHLRLGLIQANADQFKEAIGLRETCCEGWAGLAMLYLASRAITPARKALERVLSKIDRHHVFSLLALGNIYLQIARHEPRRSKGWEEGLDRALEFFQKCLMLDGRNFYAVNGFGIVCALRGHFAGARDAFNQIRQEEPWFLDSWLNMAHTYLEESHYAAALGIYEQVLKKVGFGEKSFGLRKIVLLYIAKSLYLLGRTMRDGEVLERALGVLSEYKEVGGGEEFLAFNVAMVQQEYAVSILQKDISARNFEEVSRAVEHLDRAILAFEEIGCLDVGPSGVDPRIARQRARQCHGMKISAKEEYERQAQAERQKIESVAELSKVRQFEEERKKAVVENEIRAKEAEEVRIGMLRKATQDRIREVQARWAKDSDGRSEE